MYTVVILTTKELHISTSVITAKLAPPTQYFVNINIILPTIIKVENINIQILLLK